MRSPRLIGQLFLGVLACVCATSEHSFSQSPSSAANQSNTKLEFVEFAPLASMDTEIELVDVDASLIVHKLKTAAQLASKSFGSDPKLSRVATEHIKYLIESEARIIPTLRANELDAGQLLLELFSRAVEGEALRAWQLELDQRCRRSYEQLLPLVKQFSGPKREAKSDEFTCRYGANSMTLDADSPLTNCTIVATFVSVSKEAAKGYFFAPTLSKAKQVTLRVPSDFLMGPSGVVSLKLDVYSDQATIEGIEFDLTENAKRSYQAAIQQLQLLSSNDPIRALRHLEKLEANDLASQYVSEIKSIRDTAKDATKQRALSIQSIIAREKQALAQMRRPGRISKEQKARLNQLIEAKEAEVKSLSDELKQLRSIR